MNKKKNENLVEIKQLVKEFFSNKLVSFLILFCFIVTTVLTIMAPKLTGTIMTEIYEELFNKLVTGKPMIFTYINKLLLLLAVIYIVEMIINYLKNSLIANVWQKYVSQLRERINNKLQELPMKYFDNVNNGKILSLLVNDVENVSNNLQNVFRELVGEILKVIAAAIMIATISPWLTLVNLVLIVVSITIITVCSRLTKKHIRNKQERISEITEALEESYVGRETIQIFSQNDKSQEKFNKRSRSYRETTIKANFVAAFAGSAFDLWQNVALAIVGVISAVLNIKGAIPIGDIYTLMNYSKITMGSLKQLSNLINDTLNILVSLRRINAYLDEEIILDTNIKTAKLDKEISLKDISFGHDGNNFVLNNVDLRIKRGNKIGIVGKTGSGKTTLANLIMKIYETNTGNIYCDNISYNELNTKEYTKNFNVITQDINGFEDTIFENVKYGNPNITYEEIIATAKRIGVNDSIMELPKGYDTKLDSNVSLGVRQMIMLLQNLVSKSPVLVMDEATNMLDKNTKETVNNIVNKIAKEKTVIVIAHDLSVIKDADYIYVVNDGKIIEEGKHDELINNNKTYSLMFA